MSFFRPNVERIAGYTPGEQPQEAGWVKLNTNENPYPPSPRVVEALQAAGARLNLYPDPLSTSFRRVVANLFGLDAEWVLPANGSDENLTILLRSFVDPGELVVYPYPSYILYETLADLQGGSHERLRLNQDWSWNRSATRDAAQRAKLVIVPNPNSPSGNRWSDEDILSLVPPCGLLVLDEAYGDFCDVPHRAELLRRPEGNRIVITRSFSKSYSLAGIRLGFALAHPHLIAGMRKVKDSYNCDRLALVAGEAALRDQPWMQANVARIRSTRERLSAELRLLGFSVVPSQANFVWATHPSRPHQSLYEELKWRKILVRFMKFPEVSFAPDGVVSGLRITVGTDGEVDLLLTALREIV
jgi:histidinol-phosphate aminotransferase